MNMMTVTTPSPSRPIPGDRLRSEPRWTRDSANGLWLRDKARIEAEKAPNIRLPLLVPDLLAHVDRALLVTGMSDAAFGRAVSGHSDLLASIRAGSRSPRRTLRLRMEEYATALIDQARHRALDVLFIDIGERGVVAMIERLVDLLDARDEDVDLEDSEAGSTRVDARGRYMDEDRIGDCGMSVDVEDSERDGTDEGDVSWTEFHSRGRQKLQRDHEPVRLGIDGHIVHEDDEDDDPREENGDERDGTNGEDELLTAGALYYAERGPGCPIADPGGSDLGVDPGVDLRPIADPEAYREQVARIRRDRCDRVVRTSPWDRQQYAEYRLKDEPRIGHVGVRGLS
jgi:hypothetical protein